MLHHDNKTTILQIQNGLAFDVDAHIQSIVMQNDSLSHAVTIIPPEHDSDNITLHYASAAENSLYLSGVFDIDGVIKIHNSAESAGYSNGKRPPQTLDL